MGRVWDIGAGTPPPPPFPDALLPPGCRAASASPRRSPPLSPPTRCISSRAALGLLKMKTQSSALPGGRPWLRDNRVNPSPATGCRPLPPPDRGSPPSSSSSSSFLQAVGLPRDPRTHLWGRTQPGLRQGGNGGMGGWGAWDGALHPYKPPHNPVWSTETPKMPTPAAASGSELTSSSLHSPIQAL